MGSATLLSGRQTIDIISKTTKYRSCERPHSLLSLKPLQWSLKFDRGRAISKTQSFSDCVILDKDAFDPDAVFLDDIVDDDVLPRLSLAVDGLTTHAEGAAGRLEMHPDDIAEAASNADTTMPVATIDPEQLEVYGWESSLWRKVCGYLGF